MWTGEVLLTSPSNSAGGGLGGEWTGDAWSIAKSQYRSGVAGGLLGASDGGLFAMTHIWGWGGKPGAEGSH